MDYERSEQFGWRPDWCHTSALAAVIVNRLRWGGDPIPFDALVPGRRIAAEADGEPDRAALVRAGGGVVMIPKPIPRG